MSSAHLALVKNQPTVDVLDYLTKLGALLQSGVLTKEEFEAKKAELRAGLSRVS